MTKKKTEKFDDESKISVRLEPAKRARMDAITAVNKAQNRGAQSASNWIREAIDEKLERHENQFAPKMPEEIGLVLEALSEMQKVLKKTNAELNGLKNEVASSKGWVRDSASLTYIVAKYVNAPIPVYLTQRFIQKPAVAALDPVKQAA